MGLVDVIQGKDRGRWQGARHGNADSSGEAGNYLVAVPDSFAESGSGFWFLITVLGVSCLWSGIPVGYPGGESLVHVEVLSN